MSRIEEQLKSEKSLGGYPPTEEQYRIREKFIIGTNIMVDAGAGSSKTSTSIYLSEQNEKLRILYLAYNRAIADEAKRSFPKNVTVKTFHGLAYGSFGKKYSHKLFRPHGKYVNVAMTVYEIKRYYNINSILCCTDDRIANLVKLTLTNFEHSADIEISEKHIPKLIIERYSNVETVKDIFDKELVVKLTIGYAKRLWKDRINPSSVVMCTHDTYLKLFQLSNPTLNYDCIIGDEFQDVNPVVADIILKQKCQRVLIGDPNQSIYGWRGAKNYLTDRDDFTRLYLSQSFRYGQTIADLAMAILNYKRDLRGFEQRTTTIGEVDKSEKYTMIFRTNAGLIIEATNLLLEGKSVKFDINQKDFIDKVYNVLYLKNGEKHKVKHKDIVIFSNYDELKDEIEYDPELRKIVNIVEKGDLDLIVSALKGYRKPDKADIELTTGHKSKGLQWDNVILAEDFIVPIDANGNYYELPDSEINLLYVCLTRAQKTLQINEAIKTILCERKNKNLIIEEIDYSISSGGA
jgi:superfamily I DNA/RNA helicase